MIDYAEHHRRHRRLSILRILAETPEYRANDSLLGMIVNEFGITSTRDQIRSELTWLREAGFVSIRDVSGVLVATLTEAGGEIAEGRRGDPGVARRTPKD